MRLLILIAAAGLAVSPACADARGLQRRGDQQEAYRAMQQGRILSLPEIRAAHPGARRRNSSASNSTAASTASSTCAAPT